MKYVTFVQVPGSPASSACTCTASSQKRRSIIDLAASLKPARGKLQKLWPDAKNPAAEHEFKSRRRSSLGNAIRLVGFKMGALGTPAMLSGESDSQQDAIVPCSDLWTTTERLVAPVPSRAPPPPPPHQPRPVPAPNRAPPPPPPVTQLPPLEEERASVKSTTSQPVSAFIRRAKTPVHRIGQLERTARRKETEAPGLGRMSSVSTIARQYRALVDYPDYLDVPAVTAEYTTLPRAEAASHDGIKLGGGAQLESHRRRSQLTPSPVSDDGTLVELDEDAAEEETPAARRFRIGLDLLTRELESALGDGGRSSGLQVWVMIEAYERLRDRMAATAAVNTEAQQAIESWLEALHAVHRDLADEAAMSESDYGDD